MDFKQEKAGVKMGNVSQLGGNWNNGVNAGSRSSNWNNTASNSNNNIGLRLVCDDNLLVSDSYGIASRLHGQPFLSSFGEHTYRFGRTLSNWFERWCRHFI
jgi:hypothetical protein